jgi:hypothetical protein
MQGKANEQVASGPQGLVGNAPVRAQKGLSLKFWLAFWAIAITNLAASFDATTLSVALPVFLRTLLSEGPLH